MTNKGLCTKIKKVLIIIGAVYLAVVVLSWIFVGFAFLISPSPPQPEVTYGEFPFEVVFEMNGETKKVKDVYVCEYDGIGVGSNGKYVKWKGYLKSTGYKYLVLIDWGTKKLVCSVGNPAYYMDDRIANSQQNTPKPVLILLDTSNGSAHRDGIEENYGIEILDYKFSDPIKNTFR